MSTIRKSRRTTLVALGLPLAMLGVLVALMAIWAPGAGRPAHAADAVNLSISSTVGAGCDSDGSTTCTVPLGSSFTVALNITMLPTQGSYGGYDMELTYAAPLSYVASSLKETGSGVWPGCVFAVGDGPFSAGDAKTACTIGVSAPNSTYLGALATLDFHCDSAGTATLTQKNGNGFTDIIDGNGTPVFEAADESLTINCGGGGGTPPPPTTPPAATNTPPPGQATATPTHGAATPTPTHAPSARGDVNGDHHVDSLDALWVLWQVAGITDHVPLPENADVNHDGRIDALDALFILWIAAGRNV